MIKAVLFDFGMVLSAPPNGDALQRLLAITGLDEATFQKHYWAHRHDYDRDTLNSNTYWQTVADGAGFTLDANTHAELKAADIRMWTDLNQPMVDWAERLMAAGYRTGILSNIGDGMSPWLVENFRWLDGFHHKLWSWELKLAKPELAIYEHAVAGLECEPGEVLFIDDKAENIAAAREAGLQAILYLGHEPGGHAAFLREMDEAGLGYLWTAASTSTAPSI